MSTNSSAVPFGIGVVLGVLGAGLLKALVASTIIVLGVNSLIPKPNKESNTCKCGQKQN